MVLRPPALVALGAAALLAAGVALAGPALSATTSASTSHVARACAVPTKAHTMGCFALRRTDIAQSLAVGPDASPAGYFPVDLINAYKLPASSTTVTVAIVDAQDDPSAESDLAAYRSQFGLPACTTANGCFRKVNQYGATSPLPSAQTGWAAEISLDVDMVSAICPTCHILLVEANSALDTDLYAAEDYATSQAKFVSNSWGGGEYSTQTADDSHFNHPGVAITVSTGDSGNGAAYPATSRYVTAVGGTSLNTASNSRGWTETAWSGAGSGCSALDAKPTWQTVTTNCTRRAEADVSAVADPYTGVAVYQTYGGSGWMVYGGTSVAAPIIASVYALAGTPGGGDYPASYPYSHGANLFDVTGGNNGSCGSPQCSAGTGWDGPTGLGTPNGTAAFAAGGVTFNNPGNQTGAVGTPVSLALTASGGTGSYSWQASGLPAGLSINASTGVIGGTPTTAGTSTVTVTVTTGTQSGSAVFSWTVVPVSAYTPIGPVRVLDTRAAIGVSTTTAVPSYGTVPLRVAGVDGVPGSGVTAVALNVTVTGPSTSGVLTVYPDGQAPPVASNLNYVAGQTVPNMVIVQATDGLVDFFNNSPGTVHIVADLAGYFSADATASRYSPVTPARLLDTRAAIGVSTTTAVPSGATVPLPVAGAGGLPSTGVTAVVLNVTVTEPSSAGVLTVYPDGQARPVASNLNYVPGQTVPNLVIVPVTDGSVDFFNNSPGTVHIVADVYGYFSHNASAGTYTPVAPLRVLDTRAAIGVPTTTALVSGQTVTLQIAGLPASGVTAVVMNVTVTGPSAAGVLTVYPADPRPLSSNLNWVPGQTVPNLVVVPVVNGTVKFFNNSPGTVHLVADLAGYFTQ